MHRMEQRRRNMGAGSRLWEALGCKALRNSRTKAQGKPWQLLGRGTKPEIKGRGPHRILCRLGLSSPALPWSTATKHRISMGANSLSKCFETGSFYVSLMTDCSECSIHFNRCGRKNQLCCLKQAGWNSRSMNSELNVSIKSADSETGLQLRDRALVLGGYAFGMLSFFEKSKRTK